MKNNIRKYFLAAAAGFSIFLSPMAVAQDVIQIEPLFEYPTAPETLTSISDRSNYLIEHFWDQMDFKSNKAVDQNALNHAMKIYATPLRWADLHIAESSINKLIEKISKNPTLLTQFTKAAEEAMYGPRAEYWIDAVYIKFLDAFTKNKKVSASRKVKYESQLKTIRNTMTGEKAPTFEFTGKKGKSEKYMPMSTPTIIIFGNPAIPDWRMTRLKMETTVPLMQAVEQGKLNILFIIPEKMDNWEKEVSNYSSSWTVGCAPEINETIDIRAEPSVYLIGSDGKIVMKNATVGEAVNNALKTLNSNQ